MLKTTLSFSNEKKKQWRRAKDMNVLLQGGSLQCCFCVCRPGHCSPPPTGGGLLHSLLLTRTPVPHVEEQLPYSDHGPQFPAAATESGNVVGTNRTCTDKQVSARSDQTDSCSWLLKCRNGNHRHFIGKSANLGTVRCDSRRIVGPLRRILCLRGVWAGRCTVSPSSWPRPHSSRYTPATETTDPSSHGLEVQQEETGS